MKMDFSHDRMVIDHSIVVSIAKLSTNLVVNSYSCIDQILHNMY